MTAVAAPFTPPARSLATWWRQLAPLKPRRFWFADWLVHRLEVLVAIATSTPLDPFSRRLLQALTESAADASRFGLDGALVERAYADLAVVGLAQKESRWTITSAGREALATGSFRLLTHQRRTLCVAAEPVCYLPLQAAGLPVAPIDPPPAPLPELHAAVARSLEWKRAAGFPDDIAAILTMDATLPAAQAWRRVPIDRPERLLAALVLRPDGSLQGFAARPDSWSLAPDAAFTLQAGAVPDLPEPALEDWHAALRTWTHGLPAEVDGLRLELGENDLTFTADAPVLALLRAKRPELARGEAALIAGDGSTRAVRLLHLPR